MISSVRYGNDIVLATRWDGCDMSDANELCEGDVLSITEVNGELWVECRDFNGDSATLIVHPSDYLLKRINGIDSFFKVITAEEYAKSMMLGGL